MTVHVGHTSSIMSPTTTNVMCSTYAAESDRQRQNNRGDWIRTSDLSLPKRVRYQAAPRPDANTE